MKYEFKVKKLDMTSGGKNAIVLHRDDAADLDLKVLDRVKVTADGKETIALVDLTDSFMKRGFVVCFSNIAKKLELDNGQIIKIEPVDKPVSVGYIKKKLEGEALRSEEIDAIIKDLMSDQLSEVELTAFITGSYIRGLDYSETISLTQSILNSGTTLKLNRKPIVDKHCVGGVPGNRTSMLIVPIIAAAGLTIPKTSSRSITSPAGTADTMEVLAPVSLDEKEIERIVEKTNGCLVWGGGVNLAAADDKLIRIRQPLKLDPRGMLLASILAKKKAVGATHVLIDIPTGVGSKMVNRNDAEVLAKEFMELGAKLEMEIHCIITPGYDPIGAAVGPSLEARETLRILKGEQVSLDLIEKSLVMSGLMLEMGGKAKEGEGRAMAEEILTSGKADAKFREIIKEQGGNPDIRAEDICIACKSTDILSCDAGRIHLINVGAISTIARIAGAPKDQGAGIYLYVEKGDKIKKGEKIMTIYAESDRKLEAAKESFAKLNPIEFDKVVLDEFDSQNKPCVYEFGKSTKKL